MRKLLLLVVLLLTATLVQSQDTEAFNRMMEVQYDGKEWKTTATHKDINYLAVLDMKKRVLTITRSNDDLSLSFVQVTSFRNVNNTYSISAILVDENNNTFPVVGTVNNGTLEINFGELIFLFYREKDSGKV